MPRDHSARFARLEAERPIVGSCCYFHDARLIGGDVRISCGSCHGFLGAARYDNCDVELLRWTGGSWQETRLATPLVPIGIDGGSGLPSFGLRNRKRFGGANKTRGRVSGSPPTRDSKASRAPRSAIIHCPNPRCGARLVLDLPATWTLSRWVDPGSVGGSPLSKIEWDVLLHREPHAPDPVRDGHVPQRSEE